ncbi:MAG TPA: peptidoglycan DD-metalloendopeptidase family protein [Rhodanobacteraceae bacterium]
MARRAGDRLQALQREADRLASEERTLLTELRQLEVERQIKAEQVKEIAGETAALERELGDTSARIAQLEHAEAQSRPELRARLVEMYKLGQARYLRLLLSTADLRRIGQASRTVAALAKMDRDRIAAHQRTLDELHATRTTLQDRQRKLAALRVEAENARAAADRAAQARTARIHEIDTRRDLNALLAGELQAAQAKLQVALRDLAGGGSTVEVAALPLKPFKGDLDWPVGGVVVKRFGRPPSGSGSSANGIEIGANDNAEAKAVHDGTVAFADSFAGYGNLVILDHGSDTYSLYGNLLDIGVKKGARIAHGQPLGTVGPTPAGGSALYFELRVDGQPVDPLQWLKRR